MTPRSTRVAALLALGAVLAFVVEAWHRTAPIDDAYIVYRYANNLVGGHGPVFNVGERVEGFTSPLWLALIAAGVALGWDPLQVGHALSLASGVAALLATLALALALLPPRHRVLAGLAPWLVLACPSFAVWTMRGLETPLFTAAATAALAALARGWFLTSVAAVGVATLVRPEGGLLFAVMFLSQMRAATTSRARLLGGVLGYAVLLGALTSLRLWYYGRPLPNTFYAKVGGVPFEATLDYIGAFIVRIGAPLAWPALRSVASNRLAWPGALWACTLTGYVAAVGSDAFLDARFFDAATPALCCLAVAGGAAGWGGSRLTDRLAVASVPVAVLWLALGPHAGAVAALLAFAVCSFAGPSRLVGTLTLGAAALAAALWLAPPRADPLTALAQPFPHVHGAVRTTRHEARQANIGYATYFQRQAHAFAERLRAVRPPVRSVAAIGIGGLGYWMPELHIIDLVGLVDPVIARSHMSLANRHRALPGHLRSNVAYVLALRPDYILIPQGVGPSELLGVPAATELLSAPGFGALYAWDKRVRGFALRSRPRPGR